MATSRCFGAGRPPFRMAMTSWPCTTCRRSTTSDACWPAWTAGLRGVVDARSPERAEDVDREKRGDRPGHRRRDMGFQPPPPRVEDGPDAVGQERGVDLG